MRDFFRGWKRKVGATTLILSLIVLVIWTRSLITCDTLDLFIFGSPVQLYFIDSRLVLSYSSGPDWSDWFSVHWDTSKHVTSLDELFGGPFNLTYEFLGCGFRRTYWFKVLVIPYWSFICPLTLISAWLLLSKQPKPVRATNPEIQKTPFRTAFRNVVSFLTGWRRKTACVTLALACAVSACWMRSEFWSDMFSIPSGDCVHGIRMLSGQVRWSTLWPRKGKGEPLTRQFEWTTESTAELRERIAESQFMRSATSRDEDKKILGFYFRGKKPIHGWGSHSSVLIFQCWSVVFPLTLLSAYLLISKPRPTKKAAPTQPPEPDHA